MAEYKPIVLVNENGCEHCCETEEQYRAFIAAGWKKPKATKTKAANTDSDTENAHKA